MSIRLLGLDLDGTLLDPGGQLPAYVRDAVHRVRARGVEVVLCTGRRFRTALPIAQELGLSGPIVISNGGLVKEISSAETRYQTCLEVDVYAELLHAMRQHGPPLVYIDGYHEATDFLTERVDDAHPFQREYLDDHGEFCRVVADLEEARPPGVLMMTTMAEPSALETLRERVLGALGDRVSTHSLINKNYRGNILEFFAPESSKWNALRRVAAELGVEEAEIAAVGDDTNDVTMLRGAALGIAMGNAVPAAKEVATLVVRSNAEGGAVEALERVLLGS
jgi:Cof subfamily protein (haloacid dehalogenase superfamily)